MSWNPNSKNGKVLKKKSHLPCADCGSSDGLTHYDQGVDGIWSHCFVCNKRNLISKVEKEPVVVESRLKGIEQETLDFFGVTEGSDLSVSFPYANSQGNVVAFKVRSIDKKFHFKGNTEELTLFGMNKFPANGKYITVTEGEIDCLSAYEMMGSKWPVVSVRSASQTLSEAEYKYLNSFDNIVLNFDSDEPGQKAVRKFAQIFPLGKAKILKLRDAKDADDYRLKGLGRKYQEEWWKAEAYKPQGLVYGRNTWELLEKDDHKETLPYPWKGLNSVLTGVYTPQLVVVSAGSGVGKSQIIKEIMYDLVKRHQEKVGCAFLEESVKRSVQDFVSIEMNKNLRLPEVEVSLEDKEKAWKSLMEQGKFIFWDHFGGADIDTVEEQLRYMAKGFGAKYIILDHISMLVSGGDQGDERKALDAIMTRLRKMVQELNICLFVVSHLKRPDGTPHEEGGVTSLAQLRGSHAIAQLADTVLGLERNGQDEDLIVRNTTTIRVLKNRLTGETGPATHLLWTRETARLKEIDINPAKEEEETKTNDSI